MGAMSWGRRSPSSRRRSQPTRARPHCIAVGSGTDALLLALMALEIGPGDEVITTPFSFIATAEVIVLLGATPVFVDIDPRTYNIDPSLIEPAITPNTKAIMPVSLYGQCADLDAINEIAARHALPVIEDAAQSFGATYKGRRSCSLSTLAATSFFPSKPLGCYGEGGAIFTDDEALAQACRELRTHGEESRYHHVRIGLNARMDSIQAAVLLAKLEIFDQEVEARVRIGQHYTRLIEESFANVEPNLAVTPPYIELHNRSVYAQYTIEMTTRDSVRACLAEKEIPTAVHYPVALHRQPAFASLGQAVGSFPVAEGAASRVVSLPMHPYLSAPEQRQIIDELRIATAAKLQS